MWQSLPESPPILTGPCSRISPSNCGPLPGNSWLLARPCWCLPGCLVRVYAYWRGNPGHSECRANPARDCNATPRPCRMASLTIEPAAEQTFRAETVTEARSRSMRIARRRCFALRGPRYQTVGATGRQRHATSAAVRDRSRRYGAGAERFHRRHDRFEQGPVSTRSRAIADKRAKDLFEGKAVPLKDYQQTQATLIQAQNDCARRKRRWRRRVTGCESSA